MKFSLRNLILVNFVMAIGLGAILGTPGADHFKENKTEAELIRQAQSYLKPITEEELREYLHQRAAALAVAD